MTNALSAVSQSFDDSEGGLDGVMQVLACEVSSCWTRSKNLSVTSAFVLVFFLSSMESSIFLDRQSAFSIFSQYIPLHTHLYIHTSTYTPLYTHLYDLPPLFFQIHIAIFC